MMQGRQSITDSDRDGRKGEKVRVYEIAKEVGLPNRELLAKVRGLGIDVKNHMSLIDVDDVQRVRRAIEKERQQSREVQRITATVIRRRSKTGAVPAAEAQAPAETEARPVAPPAPRERVVERAEVPVVEAAPQVREVRPPVESDLEREDEEIEAAPPVEREVQPEPETPRVEELEPSEPEPQVTAAAKPEPPAAPVEAAPKAPPAAPGSEFPPLPASLLGTAPAPKPPSPAVTPRPLTGALPPSPAAVAAGQTAAPPRPQHRYAPGYEPGGPLAQKLLERKAAQQAAAAAAAAAAAGTGGEPELVSAAEAAARLMAAGNRPSRPKVVITDLDERRNAMRREMMGKEAYARGAAFGKPGGPSRGPGPGGPRQKRRVMTTSSKKSKKTEITTPAEHKRVIRVEDAIGVGELAHQMGVKSTEVVKKLWAMGMTNVTINQAIDADTASLLANEFGYEVADMTFREDQVLQEVVDQPEDLANRAPVVTVMGHVDHGKTSLLDAIRNENVAAGEAGGITQHIGAYRVSTKTGGDLVFLDTPGHEAFTQMRARGAQCTDIVVLVVAADDGVMPQTVEAIDHAKDAKVPIIVAVNKCDKPDANPERVRNAVAERGLVPEVWGGSTIFVDVSAKTRKGIDELMSSILVQSEVLELKANPAKLAKGIILEARLDRARGAMCSVLIQEGTLNVGDIVVTGEHMGKVRALLDDRGRPVKSAGPSTPVEILGLGGVPDAGDVLNAVADEKAARTLAEHRRNESRRKELAGASASKTYEEILGQIQSGAVTELKLLVKTDVHGSAEAIKEALAKLNTERVTVNVISSAVGGIHETDINLAKAAGAVILGFNVRPAGKASQLAERERVQVRIYDVIYELLDDVKSMMQGLLPKERKEKPLGRVEVRETFTIPKMGTIAGCAVVEGKVTRQAHLRLFRDNIKIYEGKVGSLRRFKDDVREVAQGYECGLSIDGYNDIRVGDVVEAYDIEEVTATLH